MPHDIPALDRSILGQLDLHPTQKRLAWQAYLEKPERVVQLARDAIESSARSPAALFMSQIAAGDHLVEPAPRVTGWRHVQGQGGVSVVADPEGIDPAPRRTGWRFVRGSHGGTYVPDPEGRDRPPPGWF